MKAGAFFCLELHHGFNDTDHELGFYLALYSALFFLFLSFLFFGAVFKIGVSTF